MPTPNGHAKFRIDPRLAALLGEAYRSTEQALKELVDNAWDADAQNVEITLPALMSSLPIIVKDDGSGMTDREVQDEYLAIASDRRSRKGERTALRNRLVKGRKGIGKFAGLVAADIMEVFTTSKGIKTRIEISKQALLDGRRDLVEIDLPMEVGKCDSKRRGTEITLRGLNGRFSFPDPVKLKQLLVLDYGRERDIHIKVNGEPIGHDDLPGKTFTITDTLPEAGKLVLKFTILDTAKGLRQPGIVLRAGGKVIGKPSFFGLDEREDIPKKLLNRVVGEIECDGVEPDATADWGAIVENSTAYQEVQQRIRQEVGTQIENTFRQDVNLAKARVMKEHYRRIERLPEHRRTFAEKALDAVLRKFFGEAEDRIDTMISLVLDAFERDDYWIVCQKLDEARRSDVALFAEALEDFGIFDMASIAEQATRRLRLLDDLDALAHNPVTLEKEMHKALEKNLWVFGVEYSLMASNVTLATIIGDYLDKAFKGKRANKRPDLFLAVDVRKRHLLVEFKRPDHTLSREDEAQAKMYRDDLTPGFGAMDILLVGGKVDPSISAHYDRPDIKFQSYASVFSNARSQLEWLIKELTTGRY